VATNQLKDKSSTDRAGLSHKNRPLTPVTGAWSRVGWRRTGPSPSRGQQHGAPTSRHPAPSQLLTLGIGTVYTLVGLLGFVVTSIGDFAAETDKTCSA
jgi:hypothetical protein